MTRKRLILGNVIYKLNDANKEVLVNDDIQALSTTYEKTIVKIDAKGNEYRTRETRTRTPSPQKMSELRLKRNEQIRKLLGKRDIPFMPDYDGRYDKEQEPSSKTITCHKCSKEIKSLRDIWFNGDKANCRCGTPLII